MLLVFHNVLLQILSYFQLLFLRCWYFTR